MKKMGELKVKEYNRYLQLKKKKYDHRQRTTGTSKNYMYTEDGDILN